MLTLFRYFYEVARLGSIRRASESLDVSPSSISRQLPVFERQFGTALLDRSSQGVALTYAGELVADFTRRVLLDFETLRADIDDLRGGGRAIIRIAAIESAIGPPLAAMKAFRADFPGITFRIMTLTASEVEEAVRDGSCDLGLTLTTMPAPELRVLCGLAEPVMLALPPEHPLAGRASVALEDLLDLDLAVHESPHGVRQLVDLAFKSHGAMLKPVVSSNSLQVLRDFVRAGLGGALLTRSGGLTLAAQGQASLVAINEPILDSARLVVVVRSGRRLSRATQLLCDAIVQVLSVD